MNLKAEILNYSKKGLHSISVQISNKSNVPGVPKKWERI